MEEEQVEKRERDGDQGVGSHRGGIQSWLEMGFSPGFPTGIVDPGLKAKIFCPVSHA